MKTKRTPIKAGSAKSPVVCQDGPFIGEKLWLQNGTTAYFKYRGETGRYNGGKWEVMGESK